MHFTRLADIVRCSFRLERVICLYIGEYGFRRFADTRNKNDILRQTFCCSACLEQSAYRITWRITELEAHLFWLHVSLCWNTLRRIIDRLIDDAGQNHPPDTSGFRNYATTEAFGLKNIAELDGPLLEYLCGNFNFVVWKWAHLIRIFQYFLQVKIWCRLSLNIVTFVNKQTALFVPDASSARLLRRPIRSRRLWRQGTWRRHRIYKRYSVCR